MNDKSFTNVCRICLASGATIPIFESNEINNVQFKLSSCINEKIDDVEGYPKNICCTCDNTLDMIYSFINKFKESSNILKSGLSIVKHEDSDEYIDNGATLDFTEHNIKSEPDDDDEKTLAELLKPIEAKSENINTNKDAVKKVTKSRKRSINKTNKIASSILEGDFKWTGQKWCYSEDEKVCKKPKKNSRCVKKKNIPKILKEKVAKVKEKVPKEKSNERLCDLCGEVFPTQDKLSTHQKVTHFKSPVKCPMCSKVIVNTYYLNRHIQRRHKPKELPCPTCGRKFAFKGELRSHIKNVHNKHLKPKKTYSCKICDKTYLCPKSVIVHERSVHTGQRPAECDICGSSFYHIDYLKEHMRLHTGETPFKCPICGRGYAQRCNMKSHLRIHRMSELDAATLSKLRPNYIRLLKENRKR